MAQVLYDQFRIFIRSRPIPDSSSFNSPKRLRLIGEVTKYVSFDAILRINDVGTFTLVIPLSSTEIVSRLFGTSGDPYATGDPGGKGIVVYLEPPGEFTPETSDPVFTGPITKFAKKFDDDKNSGQGNLVLTGVCDNILWAERLVWPLGNRDIHMQAAGSEGYYTPVVEHYTQSMANSASAAAPEQTDYFQGLVCGHPATIDSTVNPPQNTAELIAGLVHTQLTVAGPSGSSPNPNEKAKMVHRLRPEVLYMPPEDAANILPDESFALVGQSAVFTSMRTLVATLGATYDTQLRFIWKPKWYNRFGSSAKARIISRVRVNPDKSDTVRFGTSVGNVLSYDYQVSAPTMTRWVLGAAGKGKSRYYALGQDKELNPPGWSDPYNRTASESEWDRMSEDFLDQTSIAWAYTSTTGPDGGTIWTKDPSGGSLERTQIDAAFRDRFPDAASGASITMEVLDTPKLRYGKHYELGDRVTVEIDGTVINEVIREVNFSDSAADGLRIVPTVGDPSATTTPSLYKQIRKLWKQLTGGQGQESSTFDKLSVGIDSPDTGDPKNGSFTIVGSSSEKSALAGATVKLIWRSTPGHSDNWAYYTDMATTTDAAGNWSFAGVITDFGASWTQYKVEITRVTDGTKVTSGYITIPAAKSSTKLENPDTKAPNAAGSHIYPAKAKVRLYGYGPPGGQMEVQHRRFGIGSFQTVNVVKGSTKITQQGWYDMYFEAFQVPPFVSDVIEIRYRVVYYDDDGFQWVSDFTGLLDGDASAAGYQAYLG